MIDSMYMWVLDFEEGTVHKYEVTDVFWDDDYTQEDFLVENDHHPSNCEWMVTGYGYYNNAS